MSVATLADGDVLVRQDESMDSLYVVLSGTVGLSLVDSRGIGHDLGEVGTGNLVGGMNAFSESPSPATVKALGPVTLGVLSKSGFWGFADVCPEGQLTLIEALRPQLRRHRLWVALYASAMFRDVERGALIDLEPEFELTALYGGEVLFRQGEAGDSLYIVVSGRLRVVYTDCDGVETVLAELGAGETVGEMAMMSGEPRSATVYAARDTELAKLTKASVDRVVERHPAPMLRMLTGRLVSRLRNASRRERGRTVISTVAVVPLGPHIPVREFASRLASALGRLGRTLHLTSEFVDSHAGRPGIAQALDRDGGSTGLVEWLAEREVENRYILYEGDPGISPWTERCVRQADRIVLVASGPDDHAVGEIEAELLNQGPVARTPQTLVLVHEDATSAPSGTARWLAGRNLQRHLHVRRSAASDYDRVARYLTGSAVGLALGGGFARGLAHLGVWRAMQDVNIPVDAIGGSSMGAIVGAQLALGWDAARIVHEMRTGFGESFDDMTIPFLSFKRGGKASRFLRGLFKDVQIEDLWVPYFSVSANLNRSEVRVHTTGSLARAVLSSSRAPGIFPPIVIDGELHVDGGLINNVPVDIMRSFSNDGLVIGVDVSPPHELHDLSDYGEDVSGWRAAWHRFNPSRRKRIYHPSILLVLMRIIEFGGISYRRQKANMADVYISPDVLRFPRNDFPSAAQIVAAGYDASLAKLREWAKTAPDDLRTRRPDLFRERFEPCVGAPETATG
jgi:NTE family protein